MKQKKIEALISQAETLATNIREKELLVDESNPVVTAEQHQYNNLTKEIYAVQDRNRG